MKKRSAWALIATVALAAVILVETAPLADDQVPLVVAQEEYSPVCETPYGYCYVDLLPVGEICYCDGDQGFIVPE